MSDDILVETVGATRVVTIHRPQARNALTPGVLAGLRDAFRQASTDRAVRCVVLTGSGEHFCAGADLNLILADPEIDRHLEGYLDAFHDLVQSVVRCDKPTIAMVDGAAVGFGADLAFACDLRVLTTRAYTQEKFVQIGLIPDGGGSFWLPRLVGTAKAMHMILLAERVDASVLHDLGVASAVVDADRLREATLAIARQIRVRPSPRLCRRQAHRLRQLGIARRRAATRARRAIETPAKRRLRRRGRRLEGAPQSAVRRPIRRRATSTPTPTTSTPTPTSTPDLDPRPRPPTSTPDLDPRPRPPTSTPNLDPETA